MQDTIKGSQHVEHIDAMSPSLNEQEKAGSDGHTTSATYTFSPKEERRVLRKIDFLLLPLMIITYALQYMDKVILNGASQFGIVEDLHLYQILGFEGPEHKPILDLHRFSYVTLIFYWGYLAGVFPAAFLAQKAPLGKFLAIIVVIWGAVTMLTAAVTTYEGLLAQRFFLGFTEAGAGPGFSLMVPLFWKRDEQPLRYAMWYTSQGIGGFLGGFLVWAIGHINGQLAPWRYQYLILGAVTVAWGLLMIYALPNDPDSTRFLKPAERAVLSARIKLEQVSQQNKTIKLYQVREALLDPKTWLVVISTYCIHFVNGAISGFGAIIVRSFGYSGVQAVLVIGCIGLYLIVVLLITGIASLYVANIRTIIWCFCEVVVIVGAALVWKVSWEASRATALAGFFLMVTFPPAYTMVLSLSGANITGYTKKVVVMSLVWIMYCISNGTAPLFVLATEVSAQYPTMFKGVIATASISIACALGMRFYLSYENRKRDEELDPVARAMNAAQDLTDWENTHFYYTL